MAGAGSPRALGTAFGSRTGRIAGTDVKGGPAMVMAEPAYVTAAPETAERRGTDRRRGVAALLSAVTTGLSVAREPGPLRERFEDELRALVRARSISVRDEPQPAASNVTCIDIPPGAAHQRARIEALFEPARMLDGWTCQMLECGAQIAALLLEMERVQGRPSLAVRSKADGAAPLIGSSAPIRAVRERIERVAATDFTVLIEGAMGPQPHPSFIDVFGEAPFGGGQGAVAGAGQDQEAVKTDPPPFCVIRRSTTASYGGAPWACKHFGVTREERTWLLGLATAGTCSCGGGAA